MKRDHCHITGLVAFIATLMAVVALSKIGGTGADLAIMTGLCAVTLAKTEGERLRALSNFRLLYGIKHADMIGSAAEINARSVAPIAPIHAIGSRWVIRGKKPVPHIFRMTDNTEIGDAVVTGVPIDVVENPGLLPGRHFPDHTMRHEARPIDVAVKISQLALGSKRWPSGISAVPAGANIDSGKHVSRALLPIQKARLRIAFEKLVKGFHIWQLLCSHGAVLSRGGQGRTLLAQCFRPAFTRRITICSQVEAEL